MGLEALVARVKIKKKTSEDETFRAVTAGSSEFDLETRSQAVSNLVSSHRDVKKLDRQIRRNTIYYLTSVLGAVATPIALVTSNIDYSSLLTEAGVLASSVVIGATVVNYLAGRLRTNERKRRLRKGEIEKYLMHANGEDVTINNQHALYKLELDRIVYNCSAMQSFSQLELLGLLPNGKLSRNVEIYDNHIEFTITDSYMAEGGMNFLHQTDTKFHYRVFIQKDFYRATNFRFGRKKWVGEYLRRIEEENPEAYDLLVSKLPKK